VLWGARCAVGALRGAVVCCGDAVGVPWGCFGGAAGGLWECCGFAAGALRECCGVQGVQWV
jgi:hypothetical protein